ncbi:MAG: FAD-binding oxidoreductase [Ornithinimicrobium sp.]|uniref:FAD-binding oxidoreductase n=1 Tax=Ornithinimicrobium sp. TaxID=1977084 RepID=UPI003D9B57F6
MDTSAGDTLQHADAEGDRVERPASLAETAELLRRTGGSVLVRGGGTKLDWAGRVPDPDLVLDTTELHGVLTHNPADMTASVRAGTTLESLQQHLAQDGQWLALDPPTAGHGATIGGLLAAGDSGPSRLRYGGIRDLVIGVTLVLADGTIARSGGHVIKNVAGYDLAKLMHGSLGSLALVAEVVMRLHPRPPSSLTVSGGADARQATAAALALMAGPLEPVAVEWTSARVGSDDAGRLFVRVDGSPEYAESAAARVVSLLAESGVRAAPLDETAATAAWRGQADAVVGSAEETVLRVCGLPSDLADLADTAYRLAEQSSLDLQIASSAALGMHTLRVAGDPQAQAPWVTGVRAHALGRGASVLLRQRPRELDDVVDALGPPPSTAPLLGRVKAAFDPTGRFAPGRFRGWY